MQLCLLCAAGTLQLVYILHGALLYRPSPRIAHCTLCITCLPARRPEMLATRYFLPLAALTLAVALCAYAACNNVQGVCYTTWTIS